jgi:hypothetical protein
MSAVPAPATTLRDLRRRLAEEYPDARPLVERDAQRLAVPVPTGIEALDRALPGGGFPRGKLTAWTPDGGAAAVLRAACRAVMAAGERAAWIDGSRTATFGWAGGSGEREAFRPQGAMMKHGPTGIRGGDNAAAVRPDPRSPDLIPLVVHPPDRLSALKGAELLLRSGAFGLVVLEGADALGPEVVRLTRAARDGGGAFVALTTVGSMAALRVTSRLVTHGSAHRSGPSEEDGLRWQSDPFGDPASFRSVRAEVRIRSLGWNAKASLVFRVAPYELRCAVEPGVDRRGASRP